MTDAKRYRVPEGCPIYGGKLFQHDPNSDPKWRGSDGVEQWSAALDALLWAGKLEEVEEEKPEWEVSAMDTDVGRTKVAVIKHGQPLSIQGQLETSSKVYKFLNAPPHVQDLMMFWAKERELPKEGETHYWIIFDRFRSKYFAVNDDSASKYGIGVWHSFGTTDKAEAQRMADALNKLYGRE